MKRVVCEDHLDIGVDQKPKSIVGGLYPREVEELYAEVAKAAQNRRNEEIEEDLKLLSRQIRAMQDGIAEFANRSKPDTPTSKNSTAKGA